MALWGPQVAPSVSSGILAAAWQQLQVQTQMVRRQKRVPWSAEKEMGWTIKG